jgi:hypothetical protein
MTKEINKRVKMTFLEVLKKFPILEHSNFADCFRLLHNQQKGKG